MIMFCHAELLICATVLQHRLSIATVFLSFQIQDNEDDFRGTAQYGLMLSHLYCLMCLLQMCEHQLHDEAASKLWSCQHAQSARNIEKKQACPGN